MPPAAGTLQWIRSLAKREITLQQQLQGLPARLLEDNLVVLTTKLAKELSTSLTQMEDELCSGWAQKVNQSRASSLPH